MAWASIALTFSFSIPLWFRQSQHLRSQGQGHLPHPPGGGQAPPREVHAGRFAQRFLAAPPLQVETSLQQWLCVYECPSPCRSAISLCTAPGYAVGRRNRTYCAISTYMYFCCYNSTSLSMYALFCVYCSKHKSVCSRVRSLCTSVFFPGVLGILDSMRVLESTVLQTTVSLQLARSFL